MTRPAEPRPLVLRRTKGGSLTLTSSSSARVGPSRHFRGGPALRKTVFTFRFVSAGFATFGGSFVEGPGADFVTISAFVGSGFTSGDTFPECCFVG